MRTSSNRDTIYIGRDAGKDIIHAIKNAKKSVKIVSPYLSPDYIKELIKLHHEGKEITLVTCDSIETNPYSDFKRTDLVRKEELFDKGKDKLKRKLFSIFVYSLAAALALSVFGLIKISFLALPAILFLISLLALGLRAVIEPNSESYAPIFRVKVFDSHSGKNPRSTELVHSKIFVIDESVAFLGSANFTYSGFKTHHETVICVEDAAAVSEISKEVESLFNSKELKAKSVEDWVR